MAEEEIGLRITLRDRRSAAQGLQATKGELDDVGDAAETAGRKAEASGRKWDRLRGAFGAVGRDIGAVGRGLVYGATTVTALGAAAAAVGVKTAAAMETAKIGFTTMLGSGKRARAFLGDLSAFAAKTPFEFPELQTAASSLVSVGIDADKVIPIMTTLGNVTSGMGTGSEGIQRATVALQQMTAAQRITGEDLNQLRDAGIPVYDLLAAATGKSKQKIVELAQAGKLGKKELDAMMGALETGKGLERFDGLMEKQSASLSGVWSTLKDTVTMGLAKAVKPAMPMIKELTLGASDLASKAMPHLRDGVKSFVGWLQRMVDAYKRGGIKEIFSTLRGDGATKGHSLLSTLGAALAGIDWSKFGAKAKNALGAVGDALSNVDWGQVGTTIKNALTPIGDALAGIDWGQLGAATLDGINDTVSVFGVVIGFAADHVDLLADHLPLLIAAFVAYKTAQAISNVVSLASLPIEAAKVGVFAAHTAALRANTAQMMLNNNVEKVGMLTRLRSTVATVASTAAGLAASAASKAWAAAQWLLNVAMTANPIGLIIVGIVALVAVVVLIATKTTWFQTLWSKAWGGIKAAASAVWNWIKGNWPLLLAILTGPIGIAVLVIVKHWDKIKDGAGAVKSFITDKFDALVGFFRGLPGRIAKVASGMFDGIKNAFKSAVNWIIGAWNGLEFHLPGFDPPGPGPKFDGITIGTPNLPELARGGRVAGGMPYIVGDAGRPELFVPDTSGIVLPRVPSVSDIDASVLTDDTDVRVGPAWPGGPITLQLVVDGQVLGEAVLDDFDDRAARR